MLKFDEPLRLCLRRLIRRNDICATFLSQKGNILARFQRYIRRPHIALRRETFRRQTRIFLVFRARVLLRQDSNLRRLHECIKQWSPGLVSFYKRTVGIKEHVEEVFYDTEKKKLSQDDISRKLKEQLELLKSGKRHTTLMQPSINEEKLTDLKLKCNEQLTRSPSNEKDVEKSLDEQFRLDLKSPEVDVNHRDKDALINKADNVKTATKRLYSVNSENSLKELDKTGEKKEADKQEEKAELRNNICDEPQLVSLNLKEENANNGRNNNFLDKLIDKVGCKITSNRQLVDKNQNLSNECMDTIDNFRGFADTNLVPGMLMTPIVPENQNTSQDFNPVFISESLDEYMRKNSLGASFKGDHEPIVLHRQYKPVDLEGLVSEKCLPPPLEMPAIPINLLKLRTVAERKQYLQRMPRDFRMAIINNEAAIYRELQRKIRLHKNKSTSQTHAQSANSPMSFTRNGWKAASFINTEFGKYYFQMIECTDDNETCSVRLRGVLSNNEHFRKTPYCSVVKKSNNNICSNNCIDVKNFAHLKPIRSLLTNDYHHYKDTFIVNDKPCPLVYKSYRKPLDDDETALKLAGNSMALVQMPTIELQLFPEVGKSFNELVKRYLQHIMPFENITKEWAKFSVSTLQKENLSLTDSENNNAETPFNFVIPYQNDCDRVLVRKVISRSEKLDEVFYIGDDNFKDCLKQFSFRENISSDDQELIECADILSDMINSVAISCSENSFIKDDTNALEKCNDTQSNGITEPNAMLTNCSSNVTGPIISCSFSGANRKQNRLLLELKRLNATIIDADSGRDKDNLQPCFKEYCSMGCVCQSLNKNRSQNHCGKAKCILECQCKNNQRSIMSLQTDEKSISDEDAIMLRRKATARLARMEKEFTSTIVLTGNEAVLINEANQAKKRRSTKVPKRFEDFDEVSADELYIPKRNQQQLSSSEKEISEPNQCPRLSNDEVIPVKERILSNLKHCTVNLVRLKETENMVPWCMIHNLYKCFCKGKVVEGEPFIIPTEQSTIAKDEPLNNKGNNTNTSSQCITNKGKHLENKQFSEEQVTMEKGSSNNKSQPAKSKHNMSEKVAKNSITLKSNAVKVKRKLASKVDCNVEIAVTDTQIPGRKGNAKKRHISETSIKETDTVEKRIRNHEDIRAFYYGAKPDLCRRQVPIPRRMYIQLNRRRREEILQYIKHTENERTRLLLKQRISHSMNCEPQNRILLASENVDQSEKTEQLIKKLLGINQPKLPINQKGKSQYLLNEIINLIDDDDENVGSDEKSLFVEESKEPLDPGNMLKNDIRENEKLNLGQQMPQLLPLQGTSTQATAFNKRDNVTQNYKSLLPMPSSTAVAQKTMLALAAEINMSHEEFQILYSDVIRSMNSMVCKRMYDVSDAFKCDGITLPPPQSGILCIMRWTNFLTAYNQKCLYVWQVKMKDQRCSLVITVSNMMPMIVGAVGVANITALKVDRLPLMARLLIKNYSESDTHNLGVIMLGKNRSWLVKGFIRGEAKYACFKPNPISRPELTKKINIFCCLLLRKRINEEKTKLAMRKSATNVSNNANNSSTTTTNPSSSSHFLQLNNITETSPIVEKEQMISAQQQNIETDTLLSCQNGESNSAENNIENIEISSISTGGIKLENSIKHIKDMKSNLSIRKVRLSDIQDLIFPDVYKRDHKWMVVDMRNDFSHIFVPDFRELLSIDRIQKVMRHSKTIKKIIKMQFFPNAPFDLFVSPSSQRKIFVGPLSVKAEQPLMILLQSVDRKMLMREIYQTQHNIKQSPENTTSAFWLLCMGGQMHLDFGLTNSDYQPNSPKPKQAPTPTQTEIIVNNTQVQKTADNIMVKTDNPTANTILYAWQPMPTQTATVQNTAISMSPALITLPVALNQQPVFQTLTKSENASGSTQVSNVTLAQPLLFLVTGSSASTTNTFVQGGQTLLTHPIAQNNQQHQNFVALNLKPVFNSTTNNTDVVTITSVPSNDTMSSNLRTGSFNVENNDVHPPRKVIRRAPPALISMKPSSSINTHFSSKLVQPILPKLSKTSASSLSSSPIINDSITLPDDAKLSILRNGPLSSFPGSSSKNAEIVARKPLLTRTMTINSIENCSISPETPIGRNGTISNTIIRPQQVVLNNNMLTANDHNIRKKNKRLYSATKTEYKCSSGQNESIQIKCEDEQIAQKYLKIPVTSAVCSSFVKKDSNRIPPKSLSSNYGYETVVPSTSTSKALRDVTPIEETKVFIKKERTDTTNQSKTLSIINFARENRILQSTTDATVLSLQENNQVDVKKQLEKTVKYERNPELIDNTDINDSSNASFPIELPLPPSHIQYGYLVSNTVNHRFVSKRINQNYYVKFPGEGIVRFDSLQRVGTFLNRFLERNSYQFGQFPPLWRFVPASRGIQIQNYRKSLIRRQTMQVVEVDNEIRNCQQETILVDD